MRTQAHSMTCSGWSNRMRGPRRRRCLTAAAAAAVLLAGCAEDGAGARPPQPLTAKQANQVLLTADNLGEGYETDEPGDDGSTPPFGCLTALDDFDQDVDAVEADAKFAFQPDTTLGVPEVVNETLSFDTVAAAESFMSDFTDAFDNCSTVDERSENGIGVKLDVTLDDQQSTGADVDDQTNLRATGTFTYDDTALKFTVVMTLVRVSNNVIAVLTTDMAGLDEVDPLVAEYTRLVVDRLDAVTSGNEPPTDTATVTPTPRTGPPVSA